MGVGSQWELVRVPGGSINWLRKITDKGRVLVVGV